jgi:hypothetical protein
VGDDNLDGIKSKLHKELARAHSHWREHRKNEVRQRRTRERVYFIQCEGFVKIGYSHSPIRRLDEIKSTNPFACRILGTVEGGSALEWELHQALAAHRHEREWFRLTPEVQKTIERLLQGASNVIQLTPRSEATA